MKIQNLIIVSLILAILTIGAVSASENVSDNNLTVENMDVDEISAPDDNIIAADENNDEIVGSDEKNASYYDSCPDRINMEGDFWYQESHVAGITFYDGDITGNVTFSVDNDVIKTEKISQYRNINLDLTKLGLNPGNHNLTISYSGDENYTAFENNYNFELYYMCVHDSETDTDFIIEFALDSTGYFDLYIDDKKLSTVDVQEKLYERDYENCNIYVDLSELGVSFGKHNYKVEYYDGNYPNKTISGQINLDYNFKVYSYSQHYYGESAKFTIRLPYDITNNATLIANGKTYNVELDGDYTYFTFNELKYGKNEFTFTYMDSKYPKKSVNLTIDVIGNINFNPINNNEVPYNSNDCNVTITLPNTAKGNLTIYDANNLSVIKSSPLKNGKASISLSDLDNGYHYIKATYTGDDFEVEDLIKSFIIVPNVIYSKGIQVNSTGNKFTIEFWNGIEGNISIKLYTIINEGYYEPPVSEFLCEIYSGEIKKNIVATLPDNLTVGKYRISVQNNEYNSWSYPLSVRENSPNWVMKVDVPSEIGKTLDSFDYDEFWFSPENLPKDVDGYNGDYNKNALLELYIDGKLKNSRFINDDNEFDYDLTSLSLGIHTWEVKFSGDSYYQNASANGTIKVDWFSLPEELVVDYDEIRVDFKNQNQTGYINLLIDGKDYAMEFLNKGYAVICLNNITFGNHTYEFIYSGDENHEKLTKSGVFKAISYFNMDIKTWVCPPVVTVYMPDDATGDVIIEVDGKNYTKKINNGTAIIELDGLKVGEYTIVVKYLGDNKYPSHELTRSLVFNQYRINGKLKNEDEMDEDYESVSLNLPVDAKGNLVIYEQSEYNAEVDQSTLISKIPLKNGKANYTIVSKNFNRYYLKAVYDGNDYEVVSFQTEVYPKYPIVNYTSELIMGEDGKFSIDMYNATGNITLYINDVEFKTEKLVDGKISFVIPADKLQLDYNEIRGEYEGSEVIEGYIYGNIYVSPVNFTISDNFTSDGTGNVTLQLPENYGGNVTVYINGKQILTKAVSSGVNIIPVSGLKDDDDIKAVYINNKGEDYSIYSYGISVPKPEPSLNITIPEDMSVPEFNITLANDATGSIIVNIDGKNYIYDLVNGTAAVNISNLTDGDYNITIKYSGDEKYDPFTKNKNITIKNSKKTLIDPNLTISIENVIFGSDVIVKITTNTSFTGNVTVEISNKNYTVSVVNGSGNVNIKNLAVGEYTAKAIFNETDIFNSTIKSAKFSVTAKVDKITLKLKKVKVKKSAKKLVLTATLKINGQAKKGLKVIFKFNGKKFTKKTNSKGIAKVSIKKKFLKKLKKGKKVKIQASYGKTVKKLKVKVK